MIECGNCEERLYPDTDGRLRHNCKSSRSPACYSLRDKELMALALDFYSKLRAGTAGAIETDELASRIKGDEI